MSEDNRPWEVEALCSWEVGQERFEITVSGVLVQIVRVGTLDGQPWFEEHHGVARHGELVGLYLFQQRCAALFSQAMGQARRSVRT